MAKMVLDEIGRRGFITSDAKFSRRPIGGWLIDEATRLRARLPGRMEYFELPVSAIPTDDRNRKSALTPVILDGAHVPFNLAAVLHDLNRIRELAGFCVVVFGTGRDKQAFEMLDLLRQHRVDVIICTGSTSGPPSWAPGELRRFAEELDLAAEELSQPRNVVRASAKIAKNRSEQVPPRHWVGAYLTYCRTTRGIASSRKKRVCVNYPHSLNVRSGIPGSNVLAPEARRAIALRV